MKKYQIFISSTYDDLKNERAAVIETILQLGHFPLGMEAFTATSRKQMELIENAINLSDYYVLIIGDRYGSIYDGDKSFTETEYDYAVRTGKPVLSFIKQAPAYSEHTDFITKLRNFTEKVKSNKKNSMFWSNEDELAKHVSVSLSNEFIYNEQIGYIRGNEAIDGNISHNLSILNQLGISQVYEKPWKRDIRHEISASKEFYSISYAGNTFVQVHREAFIEAFENGAFIFILVGSKSSDFFKEVHLIERKHTNDGTPDLDSYVDIVINEFRKVKSESKKGKHGKIEIRSFNTEFRNAVLMHKDKNDKLTAQLTLINGGKRARDCMMMEFNGGSGLEDCKAYFDKIWKLHENDVLFNSDIDD